MMTRISSPRGKTFSSSQKLQLTSLIRIPTLLLALPRISLHSWPFLFPCPLPTPTTAYSSLLILPFNTFILNLSPSQILLRNKSLPPDFDLHILASPTPPSNASTCLPSSPTHPFTAPSKCPPDCCKPMQTTQTKPHNPLPSPIAADLSTPFYNGHVAGLITYPGFGLDASSPSLDPSGSSSSNDSSTSPSHRSAQESSDPDYSPEQSPATNPSLSHLLDSSSSTADHSPTPCSHPHSGSISSVSTSNPDSPIILLDPSTPPQPASPPTPINSSPLCSPPLPKASNPSSPSSSSKIPPPKSRYPKSSKISPIVTRRSNRPSKGARHFFNY